MRLKGKTALISGAGRNIGKTIALTFAREGANVILVARSSDDVKQVAKECEGLGVQALPVTADVAKPEEVDRAVRLGLERFGEVDVLASVAAIRPLRPFDDYSNEEWLQVFQMNLHSTFYLAKALAPGMKQRKSGSIVACGGTTSLDSQPNAAAVAASKHGLYGLIKSLAMDLGPHGVRANLIAIGAIETERRHPEWYPRAQNPDGPDGMPFKVTDVQGTPLRRNGTPQEVANVALFLACDESSYVTGDRIVCPGRRYM